MIFSSQNDYHRGKYVVERNKQIDPKLTIEEYMIRGGDVAFAGLAQDTRTLMSILLDTDLDRGSSDKYVGSAQISKGKDVTNAKEAKDFIESALQGKFLYEGQKLSVHHETAVAIKDAFQLSNTELDNAGLEAKGIEWPEDLEQHRPMSMKTDQYKNKSRLEKLVNAKERIMDDVRTRIRTPIRTPISMTMQKSTAKAKKTQNFNEIVLKRGQALDSILQNEQQIQNEHLVKVYKQLSEDLKTYLGSFKATYQEPRKIEKLMNNVSTLQQSIFESLNDEGKKEAKDDKTSQIAKLQEQKNYRQVVKNFEQKELGGPKHGSNLTLQLLQIRNIR